MNSSKASNSVGSTETGNFLQEPLFFFFSKNGKEHENTVIAALGTMINQLCRRCPFLCRILEEHHDSNLTKCSISWSVEQLSQIFRDMLRGIKEHGPVYIVIDAIDECQDGSGEDLVRTLNSTAQQQSGSKQRANIIKILVTGRRQEDVMDLLEPSQHFEMTKEQTQNDIDKLIEMGVEKLAAKRSLNGNVSYKISSFLKKNSAGMFLWVNLVLQELGARDRPLTDETIASKLSSVPVTLGAIYESIIRETPPARISDLWRTLRWLLYCKGQLHVTQLKALLCIELGFSTWHDFKNDIEFICRSLVQFETESLPPTYNSSTGSAQEPIHLRGVSGPRLDAASISEEPQDEFYYVQFVHQTARDFLHPYVQKVSIEETGGIDMNGQQAETQLAIICVRVLQRKTLHRLFGHSMGSEFSSILNCFSSHPEVCYAANHWAKHLAYAGSPSTFLMSLVKQLLTTQEARNMLMRFTYFFQDGGRTGYPVGSSLHLACYFNLPWLVRDYLAEGVDPNAPANISGTPLIWASEVGATECVEALLEAGADPNLVEFDGWSALHWTAANRHVNVCELLLRHGADPNAEDTRGFRPLDWAIERGCENIVRLLSSELITRNSPYCVQDSRNHIT
ncbi:MAG: hypothetical protein Q9195_005039 [Heterodermia aff. obscurata]